MKKYLLPETGKFYKANLHCHSTVSDGRMTPEEIKNRYKSQGYSVVAFTDHDVLVPHPELADEDFLPLNGYEMEVSEQTDAASQDRKTCHMCFVALDPDNLKQVCFHRTKYYFGNAPSFRDILQFDETKPDYEREYTHECISEMMKIGRENGFFVTYNHPTWSLENYENYMGYHHMHAMEVYNNECVLMGHCDYNEKEYDDILRGGERIFCIATDDNHSEGACCGGFTMIKAESLVYKNITNALVEGNFYASCGPEVKELWFEDGKICVKCSDAETVVMNTGHRRARRVAAQNGVGVHYAEFEVLPEDVYVRITITDKCGKKAYTNAYFTDTLFGG